MISEFNALSAKVSRLAAMALALRQENAALRQQLSNLGSEHDLLSERMELAHRRLVAVMEKLPQTVLEQVPTSEAELDADLVARAEAEEKVL